jgi:thiamine kinase-like enzyme
VHHDAAPGNLVVGADRWVLIDWDTAAPGSRLLDLAYAAHGFAPLAPSTAPLRAGRLLAALADGYGTSEDQRRELVRLLRPRTASMHALLEQGHREGVQPWARLWSEGHGETWRRDAEWAAEHEQVLLRALVG